MSDLHMRLRLTLFNDYDSDSIGFGTGIVQLLEAIERTGSIRKACSEMDMAYSKSWKILTKTEEEFGIRLLERNGRFGSLLTEDARKLISRYRSVLDAAQRAAEAKFTELYPD